MEQNKQKNKFDDDDDLEPISANFANMVRGKFILQEAESELAHQYPDAQTEDNKAMAYKFAIQTFALGTLLCAVMGVSALFGMKYYLGVDSWKEFGDKMKEILPQKARALKGFFTDIEKSLSKAAEQVKPAEKKQDK